MTFRTRFAPSPTGPLHLGHAYSAALAFDMARARSGEFLLRIEDIDQSRSRVEWEHAIFEDLTWLGLDWPEPVMRQSMRGAAYGAALDRLWEMGLLYACRCSRRDIQAAISAPQEGVETIGPDGLIYPGTCRPPAAPSGPRPRGASLRLDMARACARLDHGIEFVETGCGPEGENGWCSWYADQMIAGVGDVVVARLGMETSYHLSVVVDDAAQGISHVVRGQDLFEATRIHVLLQGLLGMGRPVYHHHRLIRDDAGKRLAKRDDARAIARYRAEGVTPQALRDMVGLAVV